MTGIATKNNEEYTWTIKVKGSNDGNSENNEIMKIIKIIKTTTMEMVKILKINQKVQIMKKMEQYHK